MSDTRLGSGRGRRFLGGAMLSMALSLGTLGIGAVGGGMALPGVAQAQENPSFNVVNRSDRPIRELYASSAEENSWGRDLLGENMLARGASFAVRLPAGQCVNDLRVVYEGGRSEERRRINTCTINQVVFGQNAQQAQGGGEGKGGSTQAGRAGNPSFNLVNNTRKTMHIVRASPTSDSSWGEDRLGNETVAPGGRFAIRLPAGECNYDIRIEYDDRSAEERRGVDLCGTATIAFPWVGR